MAVYGAHSYPGRVCLTYKYTVIREGLQVKNCESVKNCKSCQIRLLMLEYSQLEEGEYIYETINYQTR